MSALPGAPGAPLPAAVNSFQVDLNKFQAQINACQGMTGACLKTLHAINSPFTGGAGIEAALITPPFGKVYCLDGTPPPHWPLGFNHPALAKGPIKVVDALLRDYGIPSGPRAGTVQVRRSKLAQIVLGRPEVGEY